MYASGYMESLKQHTGGEGGTLAATGQRRSGYKHSEHSLPLSSVTAVSPCSIFLFVSQGVVLALDHFHLPLHAEVALVSHRCPLWW